MPSQRADRKLSQVFSLRALEANENQSVQRHDRITKRLAVRIPAVIERPLQGNPMPGLWLLLLLMMILMCYNL